VYKNIVRKQMVEYRKRALEIVDKDLENKDV